MTATVAGSVPTAGPMSMVQSLKVRLVSWSVAVPGIAGLKWTAAVALAEAQSGPPLTPEERTSPIATLVPPTLPVVRTVTPSVMELMFGSNVNLAKSAAHALDAVLECP